MKLKSILICLFIGCVIALQAQDYKVVSMESLPLDMTARNDIKQDERGRQCAVLRIATKDIPPEQREGFHFECDWNSFMVDRQIVDGEILVWVSPGLKTLRIKHAKLGTMELHTNNYGIEVKALYTYKIVLQGTMENPETAQQYLAFQISPADAELEVDGEIWPLSSRGTARRRVKEGVYHYKLTALGCEDEESTVSIADSAVMVSVTLKPISEKPKTKQHTVETKEPEKETKLPKTEQPVAERFDGSAFFVMANAAYSIAPQTSFGLTVGSVKKLGWYVNLCSNFSFVNADYECDYSGTISGMASDYSYSGAKSTSRFGVTAGIVTRISDPLYAFVGTGYGFRNVFWDMYPSITWVKCVDDSYQGISFETGLMLHFFDFGFSLGIQTIGVKYLEAKIGVGFTLRR